MERNLSEKLADAILSMQHGDTEKALAKDFLIDGMACILAGSNEDATLIVRKYAQGIDSTPAASIIGANGVCLDSYHAAMVNGVAAHFHDFDDVMTTMIGHPTVAVLPAVLALAEEVHADGKSVLNAYMTGIETCALMGRAFIPEHCKRGWHSTSSIGVFGATAAADKCD